VQQRSRWDQGPAPDEELDKVEVAIDQLERAELYVAAAIALDFAEPFRRRLLEDLRGNLVAVRRSLARPRLVDQTFNR
jgi:hypothetical protein